MKVYYVFKTIALAVTIVFFGYETIDVVAARQDTADLFSKYENPAKNDTFSLENFSPARLDALIKVQDPDFWTHNGIDPLLPLTITTITQSIVKQLYFDDFQPGFAKIKQTLIARFAVDSLTTKNAQLTAFINLVGLGEIDGRKMHGFEAAARVWFNKPFAGISEDQYLSLLAMMIKPAALPPGSPENLERTSRIKKYLAGDCKRRGFSDVSLEACKA